MSLRSLRNRLPWTHHWAVRLGTICCPRLSADARTQREPRRRGVVVQGAGHQGERFGQLMIKHVSILITLNDANTCGSGSHGNWCCSPEASPLNLSGASLLVQNSCLVSRWNFWVFSSEADKTEIWEQNVSKLQNIKGSCCFISLNQSIIAFICCIKA